MIYSYWTGSTYDAARRPTPGSPADTIASIIKLALMMSARRYLGRYLE